MGIGSVLKSAAGGRSLEDDITELVRERGNVMRGEPMPPPLPIRKMTDALTPQVQELMSTGMPIATKQLLKETSDAVDKLVSDAQNLKDQVVEWGQVLTEQSEKMRRLIAEEHAKLISASDHIRAAIAGRPYQSQLINDVPVEVELHREDE